MTKINTKTVLKDFKGKAIKNGSEDLTIGDAVSSILSGKVSNPTWGWQFGKKFATEDVVSLKAEELAFIKEEVAKNTKSTELGYMAIVGGQLLELLDGEEEDEKKSK